MALDSFEFLGGRYNRPEQIMSGPMQAFRAQNAATGRTVFIHRVSTKEAPEEQAALLKLLTTALVKSTDAKRLVLDFGEERGYWYVVTESEPQCALLREWLQLEIDAAANAHFGIAPPASSQASVAKQPTTQATSQPATDPGEFTRFLQTRTPLTPPPAKPMYVSPAAQRPAQPPTPPVPPAPPKEAVVGEFTRVFQGANPPASPPAPTPPPAVAPERPAPGEFTSFFSQNDGGQKQTPQFASGTPQRPPVSDMRPVAPPAPAPTQSETGEFTRFFKGGLPPTPPKPATPSITLPERPNNNPFVQRPNTPVMPPPTASPATKRPEIGEFTQLFSRPANAPPPQRPATASYPPAFTLPEEQVSRTDERSDDLFSDKIDIPKPLPSSQPAQGEFTRMFGSHGNSTIPVQPPSGVAPPPVKSLVEDNLPHAEPPSAPAISNQPEVGASEFTRVMQGSYGPSKPAAESPKAPAPVALPNLPKLPSIPKPAIPKLAMPKPAAAPEMLTTMAAGKNKKMIVFFCILGALVLLLIFLTLFLIKK